MVGPSNTITWLLLWDRKKIITKSKGSIRPGQTQLILSTPTKIISLGKLQSAKPTECISTSTEDPHTSTFLPITSMDKSLTIIS